MKWILRGIISWLIYKSELLQERNGKVGLGKRGQSVSSHGKTRENLSGAQVGWKIASLTKQPRSHSPHITGVMSFALQKQIGKQVPCSHSADVQPCKGCSLCMEFLPYCQEGAVVSGKCPERWSCTLLFLLQTGILSLGNTLWLFQIQPPS